MSNEEANVPEAEVNERANLGTQFKPVNPKEYQPGSEGHERMVNNIVKTYNAASPEQQRAGNRWYSDAHRAAVHVALDIDPNSKTAKAHHRGRYTPPAPEAEVNKAAGAIARTSPSMPAGMTWAKGDTLVNAGAAHEIKHMTDEQVDQVASGKPGQRKLQGLQFAHHAGGQALRAAHDIFEGRTTPEAEMTTGKTSKGADKDTRKKVGSFYENIKNPRESQVSTVDGRSHDIAVGQRLGWGDARGLTSSKSRYDVFDSAHQEATNRLREQTGNPRLMPHQVQATSWVADEQAFKGRGSNGRAKNNVPFGQ